MPKPNSILVEDPDATLDWKFDWRPLTNGAPDGESDWLDVGETIVTATITIVPSVPTTGLTLNEQTLTDSGTSVTIWLTKGTDNVNYSVTCHIATNSSPAREDDRTVIFRIRNR